MTPRLESAIAAFMKLFGSFLPSNTRDVLRELVSAIVHEARHGDDQ
jgi:hypothetical protein